MVAIRQDDLEPFDQFVAREAIRPDPPLGQSWEQWVKGLLKETFRQAERVPMNSRQESDTGRCLSDPFTNRLDISTYTQPPYITWAQYDLLYSQFGPEDMTVAEAAKMIHRRLTDALDLRHLALQTLIRIISGDPDYILERRVSYGTHLREMIRPGYPHWEPEP
jgi:hypothetical protein